MRRLLTSLILGTALLSGAQALAGNKKIQTYEQEELTDDEKALRSKPRSKVGTWKESEANQLPPETKIPWFAVGLGVLMLGVAAPFARSAYQRTAKELRDADAFVDRPAPPPVRRTRPRQ